MKEPIQYDRFYHIYNRGNNYENIFIDDDDYQHFLKFYDIYINTVADTFAWCLLKNHFHILLRIKAEEEIGYLNSANAQSDEPDKKWKTYYPEKPGENFRKKPNPSDQFKHFFSSFTKYFNKKHGRIGSLFSKNFHRIWVNDARYLTNLIVYIHNNSVKHGFAERTEDYPWSSYHTVISTLKTKLQRDDVINFFNDIDNFRYMHQIGGVDDVETLKGLVIE